MVTHWRSCQLSERRRLEGSQQINEKARQIQGEYNERPTRCPNIEPFYSLWSKVPWKKVYPLQFPNVSGTADFAEHFNNAFDILNFRSLRDCTQYRKPIMQSQNDWRFGGESEWNYSLYFRIRKSFRTACCHYKTKVWFHRYYHLLEECFRLV